MTELEIIARFMKGVPSWILTCEKTRWKCATPQITAYGETAFEACAKVIDWHVGRSLI